MDDVKDILKKLSDDGNDTFETGFEKFKKCWMMGKTYLRKFLMMVMTNIKKFPMMPKTYSRKFTIVGWH